jgi:hypothetical protein
MKHDLNGFRFRQVIELLRLQTRESNGVHQTA